MPASFEIPLSPQPQKLHVSLSGVDYTLWLNWNTQLNLWILDIGDTKENLLLQGLPLVTGTDILSQHHHITTLPPGGLVTSTDGNPDTPPNFNNLGVRSHLYYVTLP